MTCVVLGALCNGPKNSPHVFSQTPQVANESEKWQLILAFRSSLRGGEAEAAIQEILSGFTPTAQIATPSAYGVMVSQ